MPRTKPIADCTAALVLGLLVAGCAEQPGDDAQAAASPPPLAVSTAAVERIDIEAGYRTTANLAAESEAPIVARVPGEVIDILVEEGDTVERGQLLARLDGDRLRLEMQRAKTEFEQADSELRRMAELHERRLVSTAALDDMRFRVDELRARFQLNRLNADYTDVRATISGVVSERAVRTGSNVMQGATMFGITDTDMLVAYLSIPQSELGKFSVGNPVTVTTDSAPDIEIDATIARLSPTIDIKTGTFRATIYIENGANELAPGMLGRFTVAYEVHNDALVIPAVAVVREDNAAVVYAIRNGAAVRRIVRTGIEADGRIEILEGLALGDSVVLSGQSRLRDGTRVLASNSDDALVTTG